MLAEALVHISNVAGRGASTWKSRWAFFLPCEERLRLNSEGCFLGVEERGR